MDKRGKKGVALFLGLLFFIILGTIITALGWIETVQTQNQEKLGQLVLLEPKTKGEYVSIMEGNIAIGKKRAIAAGREAKKEYGYDGRYEAPSQTVSSFFPLLFCLFVFFTMLLGFLILSSKKQQSVLKLELFWMKDHLEQLKEENRMLREQRKREEAQTKALVTDISHQLKTPLASLKMCYEIADTDSFTRQEQQSFLRQGRNEVEKLHNLTQSLIQVSRLEVNMIRVEKKWGSLKKTLLGAVNSVYMKAFDKEISISVNEFEDAEVFHDAKWTQEAIVNVLDNAVKYSESGTGIEIRVQPMNSYYLLEIEDEGMGISKKEMNRIFKRFYRGESVEVQKVEGSGVGLYLTRKILEEQGGSICVKKGRRGSLFQITITKR